MTEQSQPAEVETEAEEQTDHEHQDDAQTYPAEVVRKLRDENASYRTRARDAEKRNDELSKRLHAELVKAKAVLADPTDLAFDAEHLEDDKKLADAINALIQAKPHLKGRKVSGGIGQGERSQNAAPQDFSMLLRG